MVELGAACLIAGPVACAYAAIAAIAGARRGDRRLVDSSRRAIYALCALLTVCVVVLEAAFLRSDFRSPWSPSTPRPPPRPATS